MQEPVETSSAVKQPRKFWQLHRSTWVIGTLVLLLGIVFNLGGDYWYYDNEHFIHFGMPWVFGKADAYDSVRYGSYQYPNYYDPSQKPPVSSWWSIDKVNSIKTTPLLGNVCVWMCITLGCIWLWELRRRKLTKWNQYRLIDWLWLCIIFSLGYGFTHRLYQDSRTWNKICSIQEENFLKSPRLLKKTPVIDTFPIADIPYDWFWEVCGIPMQDRPYFFNDHYYLKITSADNKNGNAIANSTAIVTQELIASITDFKHSHYYALDIGDYAETGMTAMPNAFEPLKSIRKEQALYIDLMGNIISSKLISELSHLPNIKRLTLFHAFHFNGQHLEDFKQIQELNLLDTGLDAQGMQNIGKLHQLEHLIIRYFESENCKVSGEAWRPLSNLKNLKKLSINMHTMDSQLLESIGQLTELQELNLSVKSPEKLTYLSWKILERLEKLQSISIVSESFDQTDLSQLVTIPNLKELSLYDTKMTYSAIATLKKFKSLQKLSTRKANDPKRANFTTIEIGKSKIKSVISENQPVAAETISPEWTAENEEDFKKAVGSD